MSSEYSKFRLSLYSIVFEFPSRFMEFHVAPPVSDSCTKKCNNTFWNLTLCRIVLVLGMLCAVATIIVCYFVSKNHRPDVKSRCFFVFYSSFLLFIFSFFLSSCSVDVVSSYFDDWLFRA